MVKGANLFGRPLRLGHNQIIGYLRVNLRASLKWLPKMKFFFKVFVVNFSHFVEKNFRHRDTKMNIHQKVLRFALCLRAVVPICSGLSGATAFCQPTLIGGFSSSWNSTPGSTIYF
jgi:hypothetical protein